MLTDLDPHSGWRCDRDLVIMDLCPTTSANNKENKIIRIKLVL